MTIFSDKHKQLVIIEEKLSHVMVELMGHNGDCYCDFCTEDDTKNFHNDLSMIYGKIVMLLSEDEDN